MKASMIGLLLSGLVFPGAGHVYLKRYGRAAFLAGISAICLWFLVSVALTIASDLLTQMEGGTLGLDVSAIMQAMNNPAYEPAQDKANIASWVLILCWLAGMVDSWRLGKQREKIAV